MSQDYVNSGLPSLGADEIFEPGDTILHVDPSVMWVRRDDRKIINLISRDLEEYTGYTLPRSGMSDEVAFEWVMEQSNKEMYPDA